MYNLIILQRLININCILYIDYVLHTQFQSKWNVSVAFKQM